MAESVGVDVRRNWTLRQMGIVILLGFVFLLALLPSGYAVHREIGSYGAPDAGECRGFDAGRQAEGAARAYPWPSTAAGDGRLSSDAMGRPVARAHLDLMSLNVACESIGIAKAGLRLQAESFFAAVLIGEIAAIGVVAAVLSLDGPAEPAKHAGSGDGPCGHEGCQAPGPVGDRRGTPLSVAMPFATGRGEPRHGHSGRRLAMLGMVMVASLAWRSRAKAGVGTELGADARTP